MELLMEEDEEDTEDSIPSGLLLEWLLLLLLMVEGEKKVSPVLFLIRVLFETPRDLMSCMHA
jgi:hypothetical protein